MEKLFTLFFLIFTVSSLTAQGQWEPRTPLPTGPRERAFHFTFGDKLYVGMGRSHRGYAVPSINENDVWTYEYATDTWTELDTFPGTPFRNAASFVIGDTAYIVTGHDGTDYVDFAWKYHPATDTWTEMPPFPGGPLSFPVAFAIDGKAYVTLGGIGADQPERTVYYQQLWEYDPATGQWAQRSDFPGEGRWRAFAFVIDGMAYVGGGSREADISLNFQDTYRYDPEQDIWTAVADFPEGWGFGGYAHAIDGKGYVGEGGRYLYEANYRTKVWEYDPMADHWTHVSNMPGSQQGRVLTYSGVYDGKIYVGGGRNYSDASLYYPFFGDFFVWDQDAPTETPDFEYWRELGHGPTDSTQVSVYAIAPIDENNVWALPSARYTYSEAPLEVMSTADGGTNWETFVLDTTRGYTAVNIFAHDENHVWVMATLADEATFLYQTTDAGQNWTVRLDSMDNLIEESMGLHFFDENTGLCWGNEWSNLRLLVYRTTDGGISWDLVDDPNLPEPDSWLVSYSPSGNNMFDAVGDTIWIPTDIQVLRSTDRGLSWTASEAFPFTVYSLAFEDARRGMLTSDNYWNVLRSRAMVTEDGGDTWTEIEIPEVPLSVSIEQIPGSPGAYLGHSSAFPSPYLVYTPNFGQDWVSLHAPPALYTIQFLSKDIGFAGGPILRDTPGGLYRWQGDLEAAITSVRRLTTPEQRGYQYYPNPARETLYISNPAGHRVHAVLIFDSQGRELLRKRTGTTDQAIIEMELQDLVPGFYQIQLLDDSGRYTGKLLKH